jgi:tetratricopeptide (TPR) repeat protein
MWVFEKHDKPAKIHRGRLHKAIPMAMLLVGCLGLYSSVAVAAPSFQEGMALYNSGKYAQALSTLEAVKASYPNNPWVHYYLAMSAQAVGHIEQAKAEYQWVVNSRDPKLSAQAATGLSQLSGIRVSGSGGGSTPASATPSSGGGGGGGQKLAMGKVKKVLDFWATW